MFKDKILMITGGTGSFGNAVLERFLDSDFSEIRIPYSCKLLIQELEGMNIGSRFITN